ncbi:UDP-N-acetylglucosamine--N-acetylmuramyl-(Pentapeptide) pyrophosphoryl-undecaprenol N-acetylglucosamine transferase [Elysia marginata]|uniref:UDP-N-acetylglucosamine--N-acetylmuramyl-(Pentapeptide) pyrophosphoryl-undecaprenol N-acetylglucosamine transferase n=1 Tax=Elysia marginata TaxID=1093978 RepID=A0AAV4FE00_9GAST|nr:UDP-N-acetylglucosamine--N-acetylmuramyl-(Pentapeptide) pyrophosphoryl-undecaprenol N-acetylglucosamine transferase [Elysia marginata]
MPIQPPSDKAEKFADYIFQQYICQTARFLPAMWAGIDKEDVTTTSSCEAFHMRFSKRICPHPNISATAIIDKSCHGRQKRIIQFLLSNTTLNINISGANTEEPFLTNIGTPRGGSLSPVLFIIYLEQALKNVRSTLDSPSNTTEAHLPNEIVYADDIDFIGNQPVNVKKIEETLKSKFTNSKSM